MEQTFSFLNKLKKNNDKTWFDANRPAYEQAKAEFTALVEKITALCAKFDPELSGLDPKKTLFRINRDVRFSKDKSPYKTNFGASINPGGKNSMIPGYYLHIEPGKSFLAGGCYQPAPDYLHNIRQEIDYNGKEFHKIIGNKDFIKHFKQLDISDQLKTVPKGYDKEHADAAWLRLKSFIVVQQLSDKQVKAADFATYTKEVFKAMQPLNVFLRKAKG